MIQTILVIDNDYIFSTLVKLVLEQVTNWKILTALDSKEGIALAKLYQPSAILLDIVLPNLNGLEIYYLLKSQPNTCFIPIIVTTAMAEIKEILADRVFEDIEVIIKPFDLMTLKSQVIDVCDRDRNNG